VVKSKVLEVIDSVDTSTAKTTTREVFYQIFGIPLEDPTFHTQRALRKREVDEESDAASSKTSEGSHLVYSEHNQSSSDDEPEIFKI